MPRFIVHIGSVKKIAIDADTIEQARAWIAEDSSYPDPVETAVQSPEEWGYEEFFEDAPVYGPIYDAREENWDEVEAPGVWPRV